MIATDYTALTGMPRELVERTPYITTILRFAIEMPLAFLHIAERPWQEMVCLLIDDDDDGRTVEAYVIILGSYYK